ncbi:universal stress protein [Rathayibacter soli]|uniref:universal stress protein n=1 Tax=Rathayibacter soli TaxID=3144168 RepID=UPI0027E4EB1E|nr:universal stress protein [Glaciibacter superstes]
MGGNANNRRIVVGVDGSESSIAALRRASRIAAALGASVEAVTVWHTPLSAGEYPLAFDVNPEEDARSILNTALHAAFGAQHPVWLHAFVVEGNTPKALIDESEGAEMLVLGSRGHGGFVGLLLGSVSTACAEHARCPVLIMHTADAAVTAER